MNPLFHHKSLFPEVHSAHAFDQNESTFDNSVHVIQYLDLCVQHSDSYAPHASLDRDRDALFKKIISAIKSGKLALDFVPVDASIVSIPVKCDEQYMQCVLYWCATLDATVPEVLEASARAGQDARTSSVRSTIAKIRFEDESCQTNAFFPSRH